MQLVAHEKIKDDQTGQRLDNFLITKLKGVPKSRIYRMIRSGEVRINKKRIKPDYRLCAGDEIRIPPVRQSEKKPIFVSDNLGLKLEQSILFENDNLLVINKPAGIAVHGGSGVSLGVIEAFRKLRPNQPYLELIHRIDRETSGCLLLAKKRSWLRKIHRLFEERTVKKTYIMILQSPWTGRQIQEVSVSLEKNCLVSGERFVEASASGKESTTIFTLIENFDQACLMEAQPKTGRTHQLRVHSKYLNHPILGDEKYSNNPYYGLSVKKRLYLHAKKIKFMVDDEEFKFEAPLDENFLDAIATLRNTK